MKCEDCKWVSGQEFDLWCGRHAPIVIANPNFAKGHDERVTLTEQPKVSAECVCGDFEPKEKRR